MYIEKYSWRGKCSKDNFAAVVPLAGIKRRNKEIKFRRKKMTEKKKNARISKILLAMLVFLLAGGIGFRWAFGDTIDITSFVYLIAGAISIWIFSIVLKGEPVPYPAKHKQEVKGKPEEIALSILGFVSLSGLFVTGWTLWIIPYNMGGLSAEVLAVMQRTWSYLFMANILCLMGTAICINAWSKYTVKPEHLVLMGTKVLYPGEKYRIWQWESNKAKVIEEKIFLEIELSGIQCGNYTGDVQVNTFLNIDIEEAKKQGVRNIDLSEFSEEAMKSLGLLIIEQTKSVTVEDILKGKTGVAKKMNIGGIPVIWDNSFKFSIRK